MQHLSQTMTLSHLLEQKDAETVIDPYKKGCEGSGVGFAPPAAQLSPPMILSNSDNLKGKPLQLIAAGVNRQVRRHLRPDPQEILPAATVKEETESGRGRFTTTERDHPKN